MGSAHEPYRDLSRRFVATGQVATPQGHAAHRAIGDSYPQGCRVGSFTIRVRHHRNQRSAGSELPDHVEPVAGLEDEGAVRYAVVVERVEGVRGERLARGPHVHVARPTGAEQGRRDTSPSAQPVWRATKPVPAQPAREGEAGVGARRGATDDVRQRRPDQGPAGGRRSLRRSRTCRSRPRWPCRGRSRCHRPSPRSRRTLS